MHNCWECVNLILNCLPGKEPVLCLQLNDLAQFSDTPKPSVTRLVYGKQDVAARK